jgi:hypothetical protein
MGGFASQVQAPQTSGQSSGKGGPVGQAVQQVSQPDPNPMDGKPTPQPMGKGGAQTNSATSGQPRMGMQNQYSNTVGQWDNTQIQPVQRNGKGKGA